MITVERIGEVKVKNINNEEYKAVQYILSKQCVGGSHTYTHNIDIALIEALGHNYEEGEVEFAKSIFNDVLKDMNCSAKLRK